MELIEPPIDTLGAKILQARALLRAATATYQSDRGFGLEHNDLANVLWTAEQMIEEAGEAFQRLPDSL